MDFHAVGIPSDVFSDGLGIIDLFTHLVEVNDFDFGAKLQVTTGRGELTEEHLHQGGLASTIRSNEADLVTAG